MFLSARHIGLVSASPALLWTALFFAVPFMAMFVASLFPVVGEGFSLAAYRQFFTNPSYWMALTNSLAVTTMVTVISVILAYPFAWILAFIIPERWQRLALLLAVLPQEIFSCRYLTGGGKPYLLPAAIHKNGTALIKEKLCQPGHIPG